MSRCFMCGSKDCCGAEHNECVSQEAYEKAQKIILQQDKDKYSLSQRIAELEAEVAKLNRHIERFECIAEGEKYHHGEGA